MGGAIVEAAELTPERLTDILRRSGALERGAVAAVELEEQASNWSRIAPVRVRYEPDSTGERPAALFLKMSTGITGRSEVDYYTRDYVDLADAPLVRCYDAVHQSDPPRYHLLLENLSATHANRLGQMPTLAYGRRLAEALAALHAHRWTPDAQAEIDAHPPTEAEIGRYVGYQRQGLEPMLEIGGADVDPAWERPLRELFEHHPRLMVERARDPRGIALIHGDVNPGNVLTTRKGAGQLYVIDRQPFEWSLTTWLGVADLAYAIVHPWPTELRRRLELRVLRAYHEALERRGVRDYPWERLLLDYRLAAAQSLYVAVEWCALPEDRERMRWLWSMQLKRAIDAFVDLDCAALWRNG